MLTKEELNAIRERCEKATPGKWFWNSYESVYSKLPHGISIRGREICEVNTTKICDLPKHVGRDDAIFIEHVHSDIPSLLAHIEELESLVRRWFSITESHPLDQQHVLISCDRGYIRSAVWHDYVTGGRTSEGFSPEENWTVRIVGVTHWAELPSPPKEEI